MLPHGRPAPLFEFRLFCALCVAKALRSSAARTASSTNLDDTSDEPVTPQSGEEYFVFLQKFPLGKVNLGILWHTEVVICPTEEFGELTAKHLYKLISNMENFAKIDEWLWATQIASCIRLGYGGNYGTSACSGVAKAKLDIELSSREAMVPAANGRYKEVYIYGTGHFDGLEALARMEVWGCGGWWRGSDYDPLKYNCNTFTSIVLHTVYGLSQEKPDLYVSDLVSVSGRCPPLPSRFKKNVDNARRQVAQAKAKRIAKQVAEQARKDEVETIAKQSAEQAAELITTTLRLGSAGAGIDLYPEKRGMRVVHIEADPGQPDLMVEDLITKIDEYTLSGTPEEVERIFGENFKDRVQISIERGVSHGRLVRSS